MLARLPAYWGRWAVLVAPAVRTGLSRKIKVGHHVIFRQKPISNSYRLVFFIVAKSGMDTPAACPSQCPENRLYEKYLDFPEQALSTVQFLFKVQ